ncbi:MaoC/PaaZ C-terminal domain-containing protein [Geodermatophilus poikilotrophus]|uniref:MaoC like domain-containing protein n=1 Tax=Geodermatophilus poikilotrophus TaxID=1333667 RepID=A0A1I0GS91_9ACTN|nr:MaoC/PaaZ C-terminal domain-containing protein [Geodermatophilus poikilotrophus]SET74058.1 MaoC like domain-containing protein [Geodermatophilus poikilotrophus]
MSAPDQQPDELVRTETASLRTLVQYAGASGDFYEMHYDIPFARERGHRELAVHGLLKTAWLGRLVEEWFAGRGRITVLDVSYRGMDFRDEPVSCGARVTGRDGDRVVLEVWTAGADGTRTTIGTAEVALTEGRS